MAEYSDDDRREARSSTQRHGSSDNRNIDSCLVVQDIQNTVRWRCFSELNASLLPPRYDSAPTEWGPAIEEPAMRRQGLRKWNS